MSREVNNQYFSAEQVKSGAFDKFLHCLLEQCYDKGSDLYNDIRIRTEDCGAFVVEWVQAPWSGEWGGEFKYVGEDQAIFTEHHMPDDTYQYFQDDDEYKEALSEIEAKIKEKNKYEIN